MKCKYNDGWCPYNSYGDCRLPKCVEEKLTAEDLRQIDGYLQEVRQKYLKPYKERECKNIERLCQVLENIINRLS